MANFVNYGNAETLMTEIADRLDTKEPKMFKGTTAEWNALSAEEQGGYSVKIITDDGDGTNEVYSTTETKTNKIWADGKPIYRKLVPFDISSTGNQQVTHGISNIGIFRSVDVAGSVVMRNSTAFLTGGQYIPLNGSCTGSNAVDFTFDAVFINDDNVTVQKGVQISRCTGYICLVYTKTTD